MNTPTIGIILLNWNGLEDTLDCLSSIEKSEYRNFKIYVVDNASAKDEAASITKLYPDVIVLPQNENLGFCGGNNLGIKRAINDGAEYVLILNNDTIVPKDLIGKLMKVFLELPDAGAISPVILEYPGTDTVWFAKAEWDTARAQFNLNPGNKKYEELKNIQPYETEFACGCCLLTSAEILNKTGLLDERLFAYYDEADWCKRLEKEGYKSYTIPQSFLYHKVSKSTPGLISTYLLTRNRLLWMKENLSSKQRFKSYSYLLKEFTWHQFHIWGFTKGDYSKSHSKAFIQGWKDYHLGRFGKWSKKAEKIFFDKE